MIVDLFLVYNMVKRLATPFNEWEAYKRGIIDERGKILKSRKDLRTIKERDAFGPVSYTHLTLPTIYSV